MIRGVEVEEGVDDGTRVSSEVEGGAKRELSSSVVLG